MKNNEDMVFTDIAVIGAGPAGMTAAGFSSSGDIKVILLERNKHPGKKLAITGGGRCNLTNTVPIEQFISDFGPSGKFLFGSLSKFSNKDIVDFFNSLGMKTKEERGERIFPESEEALSVLQALGKFLREKRVIVLTNWKVDEIKIEKNGQFIIKSSAGDRIMAQIVILACGGASYPQTGSDGSGAVLARMLGHNVIPLYPALVPFEIDDKEITELSGLSLKNVNFVLHSKHDDEQWRKEYSGFGEMLFTHFGISGPVPEDASRGCASLIAKGRKLRVSINLKPGLDHKKLEDRIQRDADSNPSMNMKNILCYLLPRRMVPIILKRADVNPQQKAGQLTKIQRKKISDIITDFQIDISGLRSLSEAIVTGGGVDLKEVNPVNLESRLIPGLFFCGEILDIDGPTGGYNLTAAFSTGYLAGISAREKSVKTNEL